jgi:hypothetical protein
MMPKKSLQPTRLSTALFGGRGGALGLSRSRGLFYPPKGAADKCCSPRVAELWR